MNTTGLIRNSDSASSYGRAESIEGFIEDQAFERRHTGRLRKRDNLLTGGGKGWGRSQIIHGAKAWSSINHSILSVAENKSAPRKPRGLENKYIIKLNE
jgi:hypothetical protein